MLADLPLKANAWFNHKFNAVRLQPIRELIELVPTQHHPKVRHGYVVRVDRVAMHGGALRCEVADDLVSKEVEVDPLATRPTFGTPEHRSVEGSSRIKVGNGKREVKRIHDDSLGAKGTQVQQPVAMFYVRIAYMDLDPRRLRVLLAVVRAGGVVEAGRALHLTPQAVSLHMTALERETGVVLFDRSKRRLAPTQLAIDLAGHAERIDAELVAARRSIAVSTGSPTGTVRIAAFQSAIRWLVADALPRIRRDAPGVIAEVIELSGQRSEQALRAGSIDLVIDEQDGAGPTAEQRGMHTELIRIDPYRLVAPVGQGRAIKTIRHALSQRWIAAPEGAACCDALHRLAAEQPLPRIVHTCLEFPAVLALVAAGEGVALVPSLAMVDVGGATTSVDTCRVSGLGARHLVTVQRTSRRGTEPAVDAVVKALKSESPLPRPVE